MAEKEPSLEEVLRGVPPEKLDQPCQDKHLCEVTRHVTDWPYLAPFLGISRAEMEEIRGKWPFSVPGQKIEFLRKWQEKRGRKATYRRLCKAFIKVDDVTLAEKLCDILTGQDSSSSESSENEGSGLTPPLKQRPDSSEVVGPHLIPTGGDLLVAGRERRWSEPSATPHPKIATQASPTRELAHKPHPLPSKSTPQPGGEVCLSVSNHMTHLKPSRQEVIL